MSQLINYILKQKQTNNIQCTFNQLFNFISMSSLINISSVHSEVHVIKHRKMNYMGGCQIMPADDIGESFYYPEKHDLCMLHV